MKKYDEDNAPQVDENGYSKPSKSMLKRQMHDLQALGKTLTEMSIVRVRKGPVSERLIESLELYHKSRGNEGRRRQLQHVGKVMRDEDGQAIADWIAGETLEQRLDTVRMHAAEHWRDRMLEDPAVLSEFFEHYPEARELDLHGLIRNARLEKEKNKPPKSARMLYQHLKKLVTVQVPGAPKPASSSEENTWDEDDE